MAPNGANPSMRRFILSAVLVLGAMTAPAADFSLSQNGSGTITVHTQLTYEGRGDSEASRSRFRDEFDHDSEVKPISIPS